MQDGLDGGGLHYGAGGAVLSCRCHCPTPPDTVPGPPPSGVGAPMYVRDLDEFVSLLRDRMDAGHREYGDESFERSPSELLREQEEEALDIAGWGFILWTRIRRLRKSLESTR